MSAERADLLIVGAGPVGLAAGVAAVGAGLRPLIVDRARRAGLQSYALGLHPASLRLLDEWGVAGELLDLGRRVDASAVHRDGVEIGRFAFDRLPTEFPFTLALGQPWLESALEQRLDDAGCPVLWHHHLLSFEQHADEVTAVVADVDASEDLERDGAMGVATVRAGFVLGADGGESTVRRLLDIESMRSDELASYRLIEFETETEPEATQRLVLDGRFAHALWPLAGRRGRWSLQFDGPEDDTPPAVAIERMRSHGPWVTLPARVHWDTTVAFDRRLARTLGRGRAWIAGDAARACRPVGVHSMNAGLEEVARFVGVIAGGGDVDGRLAIWSDEVRASWRGLLEPERRLTFDDDAPAWAREHAVRLIDALPATGDELVALLAQNGIRYRPV